jgi:hypothetical protein
MEVVMKNVYQTPSIEVLLIADVDIVTTSGESFDFNFGDWLKPFHKFGGSDEE